MAFKPALLLRRGLLNPLGLASFLLNAPLQPIATAFLNDRDQLARILQIRVHHFKHLEQHVVLCEVTLHTLDQLLVIVVSLDLLDAS